jgi:predicted metal-binding protein
MSEEMIDQGKVRSYPAPWEGQLLLICRKCQKKLKHSGNKKMAGLAKRLKKQGRHHEHGVHLHVIQVPCLKMCPKGGVTVCTQAALARGECSIVRTQEDVEALLGLRYQRGEGHATSLA